MAKKIPVEIGDKSKNLGELALDLLSFEIKKEPKKGYSSVVCSTNSDKMANPLLSVLQIVSIKWLLL